jgi:hypothetical protein
MSDGQYKLTGVLPECAEGQLLVRFCNLSLNDIYVPREVSVPGADGSFAARYQVSGGGQAAIAADGPGRTTSVVCPGGVVGRTFTSAEYGLLTAPASAAADALLVQAVEPAVAESSAPVVDQSAPTPSPGSATALAPPPDRVAQGFLEAMAAGDEAAARGYATDKAIQDFKDQSQESRAYPLPLLCSALSAEDAVSLGGEMSCSSTGEFSTLDFVLKEESLGWMVVGAYGGLIE